MSHTAKTPPTSNAIADLPDAKDGTVAYDTAAGKPVARINGAWESIAGGGGGTPTVVYDDGAAVGNTDQIQGDIPASWKNSDTSLKGLVIGTSCTSIGSNAFNDCSGLTGDLVIPDSVTTIEDFAFAQCTGLTSLTIGNGITSIGTYAFGFCTNITGPLVIPNSVTSIGSYSFFYNSNVTTAYLAPPLANVGSQAFYYSGLTTVYAKDAVANGWTLGAGQTVGGKTGVTVIDWTNYPNIP